MTWQGVEMEIQVPCAEGKQHPVRLRFTGWGEYEVAHNPCEELLGAVFARMAPCTHYLREQFPEEFRQDARFRKQLVEALGAVGAPAVPPLIQALGDGDSDVRWAACRALGEIGDGQAVLPLIQALGDGNSDVRWAACRALVKIGAPAVPHLIQALRDRDSDVRAAACEALGEIGDRQAVPPLIQALGDGNSDVRAAACEALVKIGDGQAVPALSVWAHAGGRVAQAALQQMGQAPLPLPEAVAQVVAQGAWGVLVRALPHKAVRAAVVELGTPAVPPLIQALGDWNSNVRAAACEALVKIGAPAVPHLIQALRDGNSDVRVAACRALGEIGAPAVPHLIQALGDGNSDVRVAACRALGQIGDPQALPHLIQALEDEGEDVRWAAREAVEQIKAKQFARNIPLD